MDIDSYTKLNSRRANKLAEQTLDEIYKRREEYWGKRIARRLEQHEQWKWLPWWKPWNEDKAKVKLLLSDVGCYEYWTTENRCWAIIRLSDVTGPLEDIFISSEDLIHIQTGEKLIEEREAEESQD